MLYTGKNWAWNRKHRAFHSDLNVIIDRIKLFVELFLIARKKDRTRCLASSPVTRA